MRYIYIYNCQMVCVTVKTLSFYFAVCSLILFSSSLVNKHKYQVNLQMWHGFFVTSKFINVECKTLFLMVQNLYIQMQGSLFEQFEVYPCRMHTSFFEQ